MWESLSPLFWLESLINLPKKLLAYLGVPPENVVIKIARVIWWAAGVVFGSIYLLYRSELDAHIKNWLEKLIRQ
jgi:hypothetical protein